MSGTVGINVVFTDLMGSTEMSSRLGPEATEELRVVHFGLLRAAIDQAEENFAAAEEMTDSLGAKFFATNDDLARAGLHFDRRDATVPGLAEHFATRALETAQANGYGSVEKRATDFLTTLVTI